MDKLRIEVKKATAVGAKLAHIFLCIDPSTARQRFIAKLSTLSQKPVRSGNREWDGPNRGWIW